MGECHEKGRKSGGRMWDMPKSKNGAPRHAALSMEQPEAFSEENGVNFDDREAPTSRTALWNAGMRHKHRGAVRIMAISLVSPIHVLTVWLFVVLTGRVGAKRIRCQFTHICQNWRKLSKNESNLFSGIRAEGEERAVVLPILLGNNSRLSSYEWSAGAPNYL